LAWSASSRVAAASRRDWGRSGPPQAPQLPFTLDSSDTSAEQFGQSCFLMVRFHTSALPHRRQGHMASCLTWVPGCSHAAESRIQHSSCQGKLRQLPPRVPAARRMHVRERGSRPGFRPRPERKCEANPGLHPGLYFTEDHPHGVQRQDMRRPSKLLNPSGVIFR
jgi:hypothetical protein